MVSRFAAIAIVFAIAASVFPSLLLGASSSPNSVAPTVPAFRAHALSDAITFDEVDFDTVVTDQYIGRGVLFGNPNARVFVTDDDSNPTAPALSGTPMFHGPIHFSFVHPGTKNARAVRGFDLDVGYINNRNSVQIRYYDRNRHLLGAVRAQSLGMNRITVRQNNIVTVEIEATSQEEAGFAIDNLSFETDATGPRVQRMAMLGDSFSSGEGLSANQGDAYDCGTDLHRDSYYVGTTVPYFVRWRNGVSCLPPAPARHANGSPVQAPRDLTRRRKETYENLCHRAGTAAPNLIREALGVRPENALFVACSGATTENLGAVTPGIPGFAIKGTEPQYPLSPHGVHGGDVQITNLREFARAKGPVDLITVGIGGNDAGFASVIKRCMVSRCLGQPSLVAWALTDFTVEGAMATVETDLYPKLKTTFSAIREEFPSATVAVFGYPDAIDPDVCHGSFGGFGIGNDEQVFLSKVYLPAINTTIREAAEASGVTFIDVSSLARGHELCTGKNSWFNGILGGDDTVVRTGNESFHPNQGYHRALRDHFMSNYVSDGRLVFTNPEPREPIRNEPIGQRIMFGQVSASARTTCGVECMLVRTCKPGECGVQIRGGQLSPNTTLRIQGVGVGSFPTAAGVGVQQTHQRQEVTEGDVADLVPFELGTVVTDSDGRFDAVIPVPAGLPAGNYAVLVGGADKNGPAQMASTSFTVEDYASRAAELAPGTVSAKVVKWGRDGLRVRLSCPKGLSVRPCRTALALHRTAKAKARLAFAERTTVRLGRAKVVTLRARTTKAADRRLASARAQLRAAKRAKARTPAARRVKARAVTRATAKVKVATAARQRIVANNRAIVARLKTRRAVVRVIDSQFQSVLVAKPVKVKKTAKAPRVRATGTKR